MPPRSSHVFLSREDFLKLLIAFHSDDSQVMRVAKAVSDTPSGGQIIMSGESLAEIASIKDLMSEASHQLFPSVPRFSAFLITLYLRF